MIPMSSLQDPVIDAFQTNLQPVHSRSRASSRGSVRSVRDRSPSLSLDDPVSIRNRVSTLKHTIRHQQAQLQTLENTLRRSPTPSSSPVKSASNSASDPYPERHSNAAAPGTISDSFSLKTQRRTSSFEILQNMAGPESLLPLPRKDGLGGLARTDSIREGVPADFNMDSLNTSQTRRTSSPTRTLSRIPVASVGHARTLAEDGNARLSSVSLSYDMQGSISHDPEHSLNASSSLQLPPSPNRRLSYAGVGNTTKVLADLQAGVVNAKNALENTKTQLRLSQRTVAQLTRQTEDLKDGRERLRLENEGLNNVVARKERLLQEVLERARKAEAEASSLKAQLKSETSSSKKTLREMEAQVQNSTAHSQKAEREYMTLRDSIKHLSDGWKQDLEKLRKEMHERETKWQKEAEKAGLKYRRLLEEIKKEKEIQSTVHELRSEDTRIRQEWTDELKTDIEELRTGIQQCDRESTVAGKIAHDVSNELSRLRSLIRAVAGTGNSDAGEST